MSLNVELAPNILDPVVLPRFMAGSLNAELLEETIDLMRQASWLKTKFVDRDLLIG
ncbi:hypothetical protein [Chamaesiphon sp. OTE_75_metabat_556]|jgi:hypothetical protein|uniref:hypothetical protein n=1 Tax=Chamaesiphon sp. OTE_75_metabat_556 TaxID=2964692 RepID=UPI00286AAA48|nr:hypothetical protein [Chamaesiphon sp. OTE_75_metabat_556]